MNSSIDLLAKSILQKDTLEQCSIQELQQLADQYPYFSAAQFLLVKKMKEENNELYKEQLQKTSLLFYNPLWLEYLMNDTGNAKVVSAETPNHVPTGIVSESHIKKEIEEELMQAADANEINAEALAQSEEKEAEQIIEQPENKSDAIEASIQEETNLSDIKKEIEEEPGQTDTAEINTETFNLSIEKEPELVIERPEIESEPVEALIQKEPDLPVELHAFKIEPIDPAKTQLTFEPYHTVDYFASQGIRFKEEEKPKDKFGQQLKSFTEWLKTLRRLPASEPIQPTDVNAEQKVEQLAGQSLQDNEVITETMAEVWEKQGNTEKAIDIYNKLSLLDPSKRAYFAAKIEELKKIN